MVSVKGRMMVNTIRRSSGNFNVAQLFSEIGDYVVRYDALDEFEEGKYEGEFFIRTTEIRNRKFGLGIITEPIAYIDDVILTDAIEGETEEVPEAIPDPIEEERSTESRKKKATPQTSDSTDMDEKALEQLFGTWPLSDEVKLDPTVGRSTLRQQTAYLKSVGYKYNPKQQVWIKSH